MHPSLDSKKISQAFSMACVELGLGANADDDARRERLSELIVSVANDGERDPTAVARRALDLMNSNEGAF